MVAELDREGIGAETTTARPIAPRGTLRLRITALAVSVAVIVLVVTSVALVTAQHELLQAGLDESLRERAAELELEVASSRSWPPALAIPPDEDVAWQVIDPGGEVLAASAGLSEAAPLASDLPAAGEPAISTRSEPALDEEAFPYRMLIHPIGSGARAALVVVATDLEDVLVSTRTLTVLLIVAIPVVAAVLAVLVWSLVGRTLRPVEDIRATVAGIDAQSLDRRVPRPPGDDEIARLAGTMNEMLDRLEDATLRQQRFVADASHELRTPLTRLRARLEVGVKDSQALGLDADREDTLREALTETIELQRLADDLLALARGDAAALAEPPVPVDLDDIVLREVRRVSEAGRVSVDATGVSAACVVGEPSGLARVVRNLLENAERHARTRITVRLGETDAEAVLVVEDDGPGIPVERREPIFERFTRLDDARARDAGGAGLGLAIVREVVERHGGSVILDPAHEHGARFVVRIPSAPT